jgi:hypothetical protein
MTRSPIGLVIIFVINAPKFDIEEIACEWIDIPKAPDLVRVAGKLKVRD